MANGQCPMRGQDVGVPGGGGGGGILATELAANTVRADCALSMSPSDHTPPAKTCISWQNYIAL